MPKKIMWLISLVGITHAQVTISFLGDCTIGCDARWPVFDEYAAKKEYSYFFSGVVHLLSADDYTVANLETAIIDTGTPREKQFRFRGKPQYLEMLTAGSVEAVTLANNHSWDYGDSGYAQTRRNLDKYGIDHFGWGTVLRKNIKGLRFVFIGQGFYIQDYVLPFIKKVRDSVDFIVVAFHWGEEKQYQPNKKQIAMAHSLIDAGVDLIVGHHPHVVQPVKIYKGKSIAYSLGNFVFGGNRNPRDKRALILQATFEKDKPIAVKTIPIKISSVDSTNDFKPVIVEKEQ
ncbi:MAG: CapA family protein [Chitinispirillaceae bacterium]|nr:CapA family protein [Chitinispirillaceae bacterium]